jgi:hypothetical protein
MENRLEFSWLEADPVQSRLQCRLGFIFAGRVGGDPNFFFSHKLRIQLPGLNVRLGKIQVGWARNCYSFYFLLFNLKLLKAAVS